MMAAKKTSKRFQKTKNSTILKRSSMPITSLLLTTAVLVSVVLISSSLLIHTGLAESKLNVPPQSSILSSALNQTKPVNNNSQFDVHITYAYIGPRKEFFSEPNPLYNQTQIPTLFAKSLYPSIIYFNFTKIPNVSTEYSDAKMEVYLIQITTDSGRTENYTYAEGTNTNPSFDNLTAFSANINDLITQYNTNGIRGGFLFNMTADSSSLDGKIGSYGSYTSQPSTKGLWSAGEPDTITITMRRIGWITVNGTTALTMVDAGSQNIIQVQLAKFGDGFLFNTIVPQANLEQIDLYNPSMPK